MALKQAIKLEYSYINLQNEFRFSGTAYSAYLFTSGIDGSFRICNPPLSPPQWGDIPLVENYCLTTIF